MCAFPPEISSSFGKSFPFPFPNFVSLCFMIEIELLECWNISVMFPYALFCTFHVETSSFFQQEFPFLFLFLCYMSKKTQRDITKLAIET